MLHVPKRWMIALTPMLVVGAVVIVSQQNAYAASAATINGSTAYQSIDGFGFSSAFGRAGVIRGLSTANQQQVLDLIFSPTTGAGLDVLRLGISSTSSSIEPNNPGGPTAAPSYVWNGDDDGQVWLAQKAQSYGVRRFYADPWSAPGYMKTNGSEANGGTLCGLQGASCSSGDWRSAYANYLIQYTKYYSQAGIPITELGFGNEIDFTATYSSMRFTTAQAVEFSKILGPLANAAGVSMTCCDAMGWESERSYASAIQADATANQYVKVFTGHSYSSQSSSALSVGGRHTWMSEWAPSGGWNANWDSGAATDGINIAQHIHTSLTGANVSGYLYWYAISTGETQAMIQGNGTSYNVSKRLWAVASFSRYIRPGATRIGATTSDGNLKLSAFRNTDGSVVIVALNVGTSATSVSYALSNTGVTTGTATPYLTNSSNSMAAQSAIAISGSAFSATIPARSLVTYRITGGTPPPTTTAPPPTTTAASPTTTAAPTTTTSRPPVTTSAPVSGACAAAYRQVGSWPGGFQGEVSVTAGNSAINGWTVKLTLPNGVSITQAWNGVLSGSAPTYTVKNQTYNGTLATNSSTTFGFLGSGAAAAPTLSCTSP